MDKTITRSDAMLFIVLALLLALGTSALQKKATPEQPVCTSKQLNNGILFCVTKDGVTPITR